VYPPRVAVIDVPGHITNGPDQGSATVDLINTETGWSPVSAGGDSSARLNARSARNASASALAGNGTHHFHDRRSGRSRL
jgi:hypothetical protein